MKSFPAGPRRAEGDHLGLWCTAGLRGIIWERRLVKRVFLRPRVVLMIATLVCGARPAFAGSHTLRMRIAPVFDGAPLQFDSLSYRTGARQKFSITRLDFLLSNFALRHHDGAWIEQTNWFAFVSARDDKANFRIDNVPAGDYDRLRFLVGLKPEVNHSQAAYYPGGHPLNPDVNGLHWGWMGGYVFLALEGKWLRPDGQQSGFSYHLATDRELMTVELPVSSQMSGDSDLRLTLDVNEILGGTHAVAFSADNISTHSRANDLFADYLRSNVERAFTARGISPAVLTDSERQRLHLEIAPGAKPYRLTISAFFPRPALPADNPLTEQGVALGRRLFFNRQLSINNSQSCSSCHNPFTAFADKTYVSIGAEGQKGTRNAMPLFNLAWKSSFFWDGRAATLREQVLLPIQNPIEMHETLTNVAAKLNADKEYPALFAGAFGHSEITADRIARALEQFLLAQVSFDSKFDGVVSSSAKFTPEEQRGFELFHREYDPVHGQFGADCFHCHGGPLFQSQTFANNGLDASFSDVGRFAATGRVGDQGEFAVPSLRNVEVTAPYMHDGRFKTLEEVVAHYCTGMKRSATLDPNLAKHPDGGVPLTQADQRALVAFLKTLTDERFHEPTSTAVAQAR
jgi:cytochrome c peroxidase